jgi:hypothetical protein
MQSSLSLSPLAQELVEPLTYHDPSRWGYVAVCTQKGTAPWSQKSIPMAKLPWYLEQLDLGQNVWIAQQEFNKSNRRVINLERLGLMYVDLDMHKMPGYRGFTPDQQVGALLLACEDESIPAPSLAVHSGGGLQVKWLLTKPVPSQALPRWRAIQSVLLHRLRPLGADPNALDASRVLRLVGSVNTARRNAPVHLVYVNECPAMGGERRADGLVSYDFELLARELLHVDRHELEQRRDVLARDIVLRDCMRAANESMWTPSAPAVAIPRAGSRTDTYPNLRRLPSTQLGWDRLTDLRHIVVLRGMEGGVPSGQRDTFMFLGACFLAQSNAAWRLQDEVQELAREFVPNWSEQDIARCIVSVKARTESALKGETLEFNGQPVDPRYRFKNQTLIDLLNITPAEERELRTIISDAEKRRRDAARADARRRAACVPTMADVELARAMLRASAQDLRRQGKSYPEISRALGISLGSAHNYCKAAE